MKKLFAGLLTTVIAVSCITFTACNLEDKIPSYAVGLKELIRENYAAEKEAEDDAKGREHIEIPLDVKTIQLDNEEWVVLRDINELRNVFTGTINDLSKNYIVANDIELKGWNSQNSYFTGKFNGNNYKFFDESESGGRSSSLFYFLKNAVVENIVFSSKSGNFSGTNWRQDNTLIARAAYDSTIKNCINYFQPKYYKTNTTMYRGGFMYAATNCVIAGCINYGDFYESNGGILYTASDCTITNCINYGNLSGYDVLGGIVSLLDGDNVIENCENYGHIIGKSGLGGIVGSVYRGTGSQLVSMQNGLDNQYYTEKQNIKSCKNHGDIYLLKEDGDNRVETTGREDSNYVNEDKKIIYEIGGIAGSVSKVENCINEGNFYGFENMGNQIKIDYLGGIVGATKLVTACENKGEMHLQQGRMLRVGNICGYLDN